MSFQGPAAVLYPLFVWWFSTGLVMWVVGLPRFTHPWTFAFASLVAVAAFFGLAEASDDTDAGGAYHAFTCVVLIWGWAEAGFLMGIVAGPRKAPATAGATGLRRLSEALAAILHHELALLVCGAGIVAISAGAENRTGLWTFAVLYLMRLSAKLNLFLGVPNRSEQFLPADVRYLASYFAHRSLNPLFPISVTASTLATGFIIERILSPETPEGVATGLTLVASLLALAILEHWFMLLPLPLDVLWGWGLSSRRPEDEKHGDGSFRSRLKGLRPRLAPPLAGALIENPVLSHRRRP